MSNQRLWKTWRVPAAWKRRLPVVWAVSIGVAFSLAVFFVVRWWEFRDIQKAFRLAAEDRATAVKGTFETELAMLELIRTGLMTDGKVERGEFREILAPFRSHTRSIQAVEWLPRVRGGRRAEFEAAAERDGFPRFQITELGKDGRMVPAAVRGEYFPVYYSGPGPCDKGVEGYDVRLGADPAARPSTWPATPARRWPADASRCAGRGQTGRLPGRPAGLRSRQAHRQPCRAPREPLGIRAGRLPARRDARCGDGQAPTGRDRRLPVRPLGAGPRPAVPFPSLADPAGRVGAGGRSPAVRARREWTSAAGSTWRGIRGRSSACRRPISSPPGGLSGLGACWRRVWP